MYLKLKQDGHAVLINEEHIRWIARWRGKGAGLCRIRAGDDKIIVDETYEQVEALLTGSGAQVYFIKEQEQAPIDEQLNNQQPGE